MQTSPRLALVLVLGAFALLAGAFALRPVASQAQQPSDPQSGPLAQPAGPAQVDAEVERSIQSGGTARVLVQLRLPVPFQPEGTLPNRAGVDRQRASIRSAQDALETALGAGAQGVKQFDTIPFLALEVDAAALAQLASSPEVIAVTIDGVDEAYLAESTPLIGASALHTAGFTGTGQMVAVLDTGVDKTHSFFGNRVTSEACFSTTSAANASTSVCPGGVSSSIALGSGIPCNLAVSGCNHGTHVAGIAAGSNATMKGVAPGATIAAIQVFSLFAAGSTACGGAGEPACTLTFTSDQIKGLERVLALKQGGANIASANMSLGGGQFFTQAACDTANVARKAAIDNARAAGVAVLIASGNDGFTNSMGAPGCISSAISVGSTTKADAISSFSNSASFLNLLAPGSSINSSVPVNTFAAFNGTSMATPQVAGAWALLKSRTPAATVAQVLNALVTTGLPVTDTRAGAPVPNITKPRIQLVQAANALGPIGSPTPSPTPVPVGPNDMFAGATVITTMPFNVQQNATNFTTQVGEPVPPVLCVNSGKSAWFKFVPGSNGQLSANTATSNYDTVLAVLQGTTLAGLTAVACNDDDTGTFQSRLTNVNLIAGQTYYIYAAAFGASSAGTLVLSASYTGSATPPPTPTPTPVGATPTPTPTPGSGCPSPTPAPPAGGARFAVAPCPANVSPVGVAGAEAAAGTVAVQVVVDANNVSNTGDGQGPGLGAWSFTLNYNQAVVTVQSSVAQQGSLCNTTVVGRIVCNGAVGAPVPSGSLLNVTFQAVAATGATSTLTLTSLTANNFGGTVVNVNFVNGVLNVRVSIPDANGDGFANPVDALCILRQVGNFAPTHVCANPLPFGDVNGIDGVNPVDALCVLRYSGGFARVTPACPYDPPVARVGGGTPPAPAPAVSPKPTPTG